LDSKVNVNSSSTPLISVVTVTRNASTELAFTSASVNQQTIRSQIQHVVIDGASEDGSASEALARKLPQDVVISERDKGIYDAMNKGIVNSAGSWIVFMNAGDRFEHSDSLEKCLPYLAEDVDMLLGETITEFRDELEVRFFHHQVIAAADWWKGMPTCHQSILYRANVLRKYPFDLQFRWCADFDQFVRIWQGGGVVSSVPFVLAHYDGNGADGRNPEIYIAERERVCRSLSLGFKAKWHFAKERIQCHYVGPCIRGLRRCIPTNLLRTFRRWRGTSGVKYTPQESKEST
jgi:glycosyltransferase involved in cell wall biosynthesis